MSLISQLTLFNKILHLLFLQTEVKDSLNSNAFIKEVLESEMKLTDSVKSESRSLRKVFKTQESFERVKKKFKNPSKFLLVRNSSFNFS